MWCPQSERHCRKTVDLFQFCVYLVIILPPGIQVQTFPVRSDTTFEEIWLQLLHHAEDQVEWQVGVADAAMWL